MNKFYFTFLAVACLCLGRKAEAAESNAFPYQLPEHKPHRPLSAAMERLYDHYPAVTPEKNELFSNFKYTRLEGFDDHGQDGTLSRRDPSKVIWVQDKYYVWYTRRHTLTPPRGPELGSDTVPSADWDLAEIWYATSAEGFRWEERGVAVADDPLGPFQKHPLNPVLNSGHETTLFPFKQGIAALVIRHGLEHNTIQFAPDGVNFEVPTTTSLMPVAGGPYVPDAFTDTSNGRGITWGLSHFAHMGTPETRHSILARFDCDLSQDMHDAWMKKTEIFLSPEVYFSQKLSDQQRAQRGKFTPQPQKPNRSTAP